MSNENGMNLKNLNELKKLVKAHEEEILSNENLRQLIESLSEEDFDIDEGDSVDEWLEMAEEADSPKESLRCARKALELEPDNLDAARAVADYSTETPEEYLKQLQELLVKGDQQMRDLHFFEDSMGEFWLNSETRPYMRLRYEYMKTLYECSMFRPVIAECEEMLRLCTNDNLGVRHTLIFAYAAIGDEKAALALRDSNDPNTKDPQFMLALALLYYRLNQMDTALMYLKRLCEVNKNTKRFFTKLYQENGLKELLDQTNPYAYRPFSLEELAVTFMENSELLLSSPSFLVWAYLSLKTPRRSKPKN